MWRRVASTAIEHSFLHLIIYWTQHGKPERGVRLQEQVLALLGPLSDAPDWQGNLIYNLACFCALAGEKEKALAYLAEALRLNPGLTAWSQQDSDLDSLRDDAAFRAIYRLGDR